MAAAMPLRFQCGAWVEVQTVADFPRITEELLRRGHSDETVRGILGENFLRLYERVVG